MCRAARPRMNDFQLGMRGLGMIGIAILIGGFGCGSSPSTVTSHGVEPAVDAGAVARARDGGIADTAPLVDAADAGEDADAPEAEDAETGVEIDTTRKRVF